MVLGQPKEKKLAISFSYGRMIRNSNLALKFPLSACG